MSRKGYLKALCKQLNALIPIKSEKDRDRLNELLNEMRHHELDYPHYALYWDRDLFIDCNGDDDKMREMTLHSGKVQFEPSEDLDEHPGVVVRYKETKEV